ncbi:psbP domain-containing protein 2, chloroplastic isoform X3 [Cryptomeria japonica]|uniref:psbP domain-containing protein 2, chloroplastic isoform X3 n=1 Tax=Cryptomeria japonica TaxID=3369 RepID=UPI0027DA1CB0|nr:psbP domain-containing protein 2, chloroplastic isoform X3 [Cryptomeria japonica]
MIKVMVLESFILAGKGCCHYHSACRCRFQLRFPSVCLNWPRVISHSSSLLSMQIGEEIKLDLERYNDKIEGFTLLIPSDWKKVDKAGATVLFEDPVVKSNNIGVVVNPIRISSLKEFGTPQVVAEKLLQAEKKKPSTNDARLIKVDQRPIHGDIPLYELEYALDSSRGIKRVLSAVTIASKKLYLLNIAYSDSPEKPLLPNTRMLLEQVLNSFDVLS